jgi:glyoxylase-like metal-dependent hydrolase (beta-lactamase superfamily II)
MTKTTMSAEQPIIHSIFEPRTSTWQYIVADPKTLAAVIIDSVLDIDPATLKLSSQSADDLLEIVRQHGYRVEKILETHAHADHVTAAAYLQSKLESESRRRPTIGIGHRIGQVQAHFGAQYQIAASEYENAFDHLFQDDEIFQIGALQAKIMHLPGHTPDHVGYQIGGMEILSSQNPLRHID